MTDTLTTEEIERTEFQLRDAKAHHEEFTSVPTTAVEKFLAMLKGVEPKQDGLEVVVKETGVWLCFRASTGKSALIHGPHLVEKLAGGPVTRHAINDWMDDVLNNTQPPSKQEVADASGGEIATDFYVQFNAVCTRENDDTLAADVAKWVMQWINKSRS